MGDKEIEMETSINSFIPNMKVKKSLENKLFYSYIQFINTKKNEAERFKKEGAKEKLANLDKEVKAFQKKIVGWKARMNCALVLVSPNSLRYVLNFTPWKDAPFLAYLP